MSRDPDSAPDLQQEAEHTHGPRHSAFLYLCVLFAVAFLLLALAYFQQQRAHEQVLQGLAQSVDAFQSVDELTAENRALRRQLELQEEELERLQAELEVARAGG